MDKVRWGVIGCGQIAADKTIPAIAAAANAELVAVADVSPERRHLIQQCYLNLAGYDDYRALLASDGVDAVYVALPNALHCPVTVASAQHRKHVLCEKPLAVTANEARAMIAACREHGVKLMTAYMSRFSEAFEEAARILSSGRLGTIAMINANFSYGAHSHYTSAKPGFWRWTGIRGGPLLDAGIYLAFTIRELMNSRVTRVSAGMWPVIAKDMPAADTVVAWFALEDGTPGILSTTYSHNQSSIEFHGEDGMLTLRDCLAQKPLGSLQCVAGAYRVRREFNDPAACHFEHYRREVEHFSDAILHQRAYRPTPREALEDMILLDAVEASAVEGRAVDVAYS